VRFYKHSTPTGPREFGRAFLPCFDKDTTLHAAQRDLHPASLSVVRPNPVDANPTQAAQSFPPDSANRRATYLETNNSPIDLERMQGLSDLDQQTIQALNRRRGFTHRTVSALFRAREILILAIASALVKVRENSDPMMVLLSQIKEKDLRIHQLELVIELLQARMNGIDARHRSHYSAQERFKIILHKQTYSLSLEQTAQTFLISVQTVARWIDQALREPAN
jgi:hypothetical protein